MAQPCNREEIGLQLQVAANKINNAKCRGFKDLHDALKELSWLILKKDAAFKQQGSAIKFNTYDGTVETNYFQIMNKIDNFLKSIDETIDRADNDDKQAFTERKQKYESVKKLLDDATTEDEVRKIINGNQVKFDSGIIILSGGTRKRKTTRRKRAKTLKNKKKVGKRK